MKCKGKDCNNEVKKGWCLICQCKFHGYEVTAEIEDGEIYGLVLTREDLVK